MYQVIISFKSGEVWTHLAWMTNPKHIKKNSFVVFFKLISETFGQKEQLYVNNTSLCWLQVLPKWLALQSDEYESQHFGKFLFILFEVHYTAELSGSVVDWVAKIGTVLEINTGNIVFTVKIHKSTIAFYWFKIWGKKCWVKIRR